MSTIHMSGGAATVKHLVAWLTELAMGDTEEEYCDIPQITIAETTYELYAFESFVDESGHSGVAFHGQNVHTKRNCLIRFREDNAVIVFNKAKNRKS